MRTKRCTGLVAAWLALAAFPACDHVDPGSADGGATDADTDGDTDTDVDTDVDTDSDTESCAEVQPNCCTAECPCPDAEDRCVYTFDGAAMDTYGVCKPETSGGECWITDDCADGEFCAGVSVCPCDMDCDWEGPGICSPVSGACCTDAPMDCPDDYFCLALEGTDTCHGVLTYPQCWTDEECFGAAPCADEVLCACDVDCVSVPGTCWMYEYD
jgi:hypothetical protein